MGARTGKRLVRRAALGLLALACLGVVAPAGAAPVDGGVRHAYAISSGPSFFAAPAACPSFPTIVPSTPNLQMAVVGWTGPVDPRTDRFTVRLTATLKGTVTDTAGNVYRVEGRFAERGERNRFTDFQVLFRGVGELTLKGKAGTFSGTATALGLGGPPERQFAFVDADACKPR